MQADSQAQAQTQRMEREGEREREREVQGNMNTDVGVKRDVERDVMAARGERSGEVGSEGVKGVR